MRRPLQVYVHEADLARLTAWSRKHGVTKSEAVRTAIRALTRGPAEDPILELSGMIDDGLPPDVSERHDEYLEETFVAERPAPYRTGRRKPAARVRR